MTLRDSAVRAEPFPTSHSNTATSLRMWVREVIAAALAHGFLF
jgi:hypothetical protein